MLLLLIRMYEFKYYGNKGDFWKISERQWQNTIKDASLTDQKSVKEWSMSFPIFESFTWLIHIKDSKIEKLIEVFIREIFCFVCPLLGVLHQQRHRPCCGRVKFSDFFYTYVCTLYERGLLTWVLNTYVRTPVFVLQNKIIRSYVRTYVRCLVCFSSKLSYWSKTDNPPA